MTRPTRHQHASTVQSTPPACTCNELAQSPTVYGFTQSSEALAWLEDHPADICLLDIDMPDMSGLALADRILEQHPNANIIYLTAYDSFAVEAFTQHVSGYLLKPVSQERLQAEVDHALRMRPTGTKPAPSPHVLIRTFGTFDLLVDGAIVAFDRAKAKELLAYLVDPSTSWPPPLSFRERTPHPHGTSLHLGYTDR